MSTASQNLRNQIRELQSALEALESSEGTESAGFEIAPLRGSQSVSVDDLVSDYIEFKMGNGAWGKSARKNLPPVLRRFSSGLQGVGGLPAVSPRNIRRKHVEGYRDALIKADRSLTTVKVQLSVVKGFLRWLVQEDILPRNVGDGVSVNARVARTRPARVAFPEEGLRELLDDYESQGGSQLPRLLSLTGLRPQELPKVKLRTQGDLLFLSLKEADTKTKAGKRVVPLSFQASEAYRQVCDLCPSEIRSESERFSKYLRSKGFGEEYVLYSARHRVATVLERKFPEQESLVAKLLGHRHKNITNSVYASETDPKSLLHLVEALEFTQK